MQIIEALSVIKLEISNNNNDDTIIITVLCFVDFHVGNFEFIFIPPV